jgi:hypothetical protein
MKTEPLDAQAASSMTSLRGDERADTSDSLRLPQI